ncbi:MAG: ABC transporter permease, partial [Sedimentisphaerales bacterium]|nr:ABC transporter permease [Sedimentisphaerales bacterium]
TAALLNRSGRRAGVSQLTIPSLAVRNLTRRSGRTLAIVALLSCGVFIIFSVGANRHDSLANAEKRSSGTGGFALMSESTLPIYNDLNSEKTRNKFLLEPKLFQQVKIVHLRVRDGDDASCLNLNQAQMPRLLGVAPEELDARGAFTFVKTLDGTDWANKHNKTDDNNNTSVDNNGTSVSHPWLLLAQKQDDGCIPAIADATTIKWAMGKAIGDKLTFTDDYGRDFKIRLVGALKNTILQGSLVISEQNFIERFPSQDGYRMFLIDCPTENSNKVSQALSDRLTEKALDVHTTVQKLGSFNAVQNTYLSIFQLLGGLGLILGSVGLGVVLMRNVLERRGEFAMLRAIGFDKKTLKRLILYEHWISLFAGLICGVGAALIAVLPAVRGAGTQVPWLQLLLTLVVVAVIGIIWIWLAAGAAMRGELLPALREE